MSLSTARPKGGLVRIRPPPLLGIASYMQNIVFAVLKVAAQYILCVCTPTPRTQCRKNITFLKFFLRKTSVCYQCRHRPDGSAREGERGRVDNRKVGVSEEKLNGAKLT
ncbi:hypothetical protein EVAR_23572_1 [Eumeta japonica]|uniref:Uncharacterized protein n=1 Tax=Eumeta variegata TaxID=151549 RepID=A0A4C1WY11_EUMVA|nr:hypothetical protein EVAR_23572_1 [Eumeta japonica]